jgi:LysR family transcriptional activator of nhaA
MEITSKTQWNTDLRKVMRLNHHHLVYFATVMHCGGVHAAARNLGVAATTISSQIKALEAKLGHGLFVRRRQRLVPTAFAERLNLHASAWLATGRKVLACMARTPDTGPSPLQIGIADGVPLLVAARILKALRGQIGDRPFVCRTTRHDFLIAELTHHRLDLVLTDRPPGKHGEIDLAVRWVESSSIAWCAASKPQKTFPDCLHHAAVILPMHGFAMRESIDSWLLQRGLQPRIIAECSESALVKTLGASGMGLFPIPAIVSDQVCSQYAVTVMGVQPGETERYMLVSHQELQLDGIDDPSLGRAELPMAPTRPHPDAKTKR